MTSVRRIKNIWIPKESTANFSPPLDDLSGSHHDRQPGGWMGYSNVPIEIFEEPEKPIGFWDGYESFIKKADPSDLMPSERHYQNKLRTKE